MARPGNTIPFGGRSSVVSAVRSRHVLTAREGPAVLSARHPPTGAPQDDRAFSCRSRANPGPENHPGVPVRGRVVQSEWCALRRDRPNGAPLRQVCGWSSPRPPGEWERAGAGTEVNGEIPQSPCKLGKRENALISGSLVGLLIHQGERSECLAIRLVPAPIRPSGTGSRGRPADLDSRPSRRSGSVGAGSGDPTGPGPRVSRDLPPPGQMFDDGREIRENRARPPLPATRPGTGPVHPDRRHPAEEVGYADVPRP